MSTDEFETPARAIAAPKDRDIASVLTFAAGFHAATGSWLAMGRFLWANLPKVVQALNEYFGQQEAIARDLGKKPE